MQIEKVIRMYKENKNHAFQNHLGEPNPVPLASPSTSFINT